MNSNNLTEIEILEGIQIHHESKLLTNNISAKSNLKNAVEMDYFIER